MFINEIPDIFKSEDTVYHYCDLNIAVEKILAEKKLKLGHRKHATDPIECLEPWFSYSSVSISDDIPPRGITENAKRIRELTLEKIANAKQLCLCTNRSQDDFKGNTILPEEYYGFLKPRMWDQYGNKYRGICLAFSLEALKSQAPDLVHKRVEYFPYRTLKLNHYSIDESRMAHVGFEQSWTEYSRRIENVLFRKHTDYESESEYKFISFSANEADQIDIKSCLRGIVVSDTYTSDFMKAALNKYAEELSVELLYLKWEATGINFTTKENLDNIISSIQELIKTPALDS